MKKKNKLRIVAEHPATMLLNMAYHNYLKPLLPNETDIYERLEDLHKKGKSLRSPLIYLTAKEIEKFLHQENVNKDINILNEMTAIVLGWKQFKQIYKFNPTLLDELFNIDISNDKYAIISKEEATYLPCYNFFVEHEITIGDEDFIGFFVYFSDHINKGEDGRPQVFLIHDLSKYPKEKNGLPTNFGFFNISLLYDTDYTGTQENADKLDTPFKVDPVDILQYINPGLFNILVEDDAMELITHITQMITYLAATNADFSRIKKPTKKLDIKRTKITDSEYEKWEIGNTIYRGHKIPTRLLDTADGAYERVEPKQVEETEEGESKPCEGSYRRKTGYHMRPHMRRAHWKHYWYGKKDGSEERVRRRKFVSAVFIDKNTDEDIQIPTREVVTYRF